MFRHACHAHDCIDAHTLNQGRDDLDSLCCTEAIHDNIIVAYCQSYVKILTITLHIHWHK